MYSHGSGVPKDDGEAVNWYRKAAGRDDIGGRLNLGFMYENGRGVHRDYVAALRWYRRAADQGSASAQDSLGYFYIHGMGVKRDDVEAVAWFRKAAEQGMAGAQYNLGAMYEHGAGLAESRTDALGWYEKGSRVGWRRQKKSSSLLHFIQSLDAPQLLATGTPPPLPPISRHAMQARGVSVVPGAIVCPDYNTVRSMFDRYVALNSCFSKTP